MATLSIIEIIGVINQLPSLLKGVNFLPGDAFRFKDGEEIFTQSITPKGAGSHESFYVPT